jgi:hypothetical protein
MTIEETKRRLTLLNREVKQLLRDSGISEYYQYTPDNFDTSRKVVKDENGYEEEVADLTADEWQLYHEYNSLLGELDTLFDRLDYLSKPITHEGELYKTSNDRFAVDGQEFQCGNRIEFQQYDDEHYCNYWIRARVEYNDNKGGYYYFGYDEPLKEGQRVRVRW